MYNVMETKTFFNPDPWNKCFEERKKQLVEAKQLGLMTVAFIYPKFDSSTFRYRAFNICETLDFSFRWRGSYFDMSEVEELSKNLELVDVLILVRCSWNFLMEDLVNRAKNTDIKVCYDMDDLIYDTKYMELVIRTLGLKEGQEWEFWFAYTIMHQKLIEMSEVTITTNEYLAEFLRKDLQKDCLVIPNYLNRIQEDVSKEYLEQKTVMRTTRPFTIGYFSGSPTHKNDLMEVWPQIIHFLEKTDDSKFQIVGYMELPDDAKKYLENGRIDRIPFQNFVSLQKKVAEVDINIVPLIVNDFTNCKSELKYFEAGIVGTVTCASPNYTYKKAMENSPCGYLCTEEEWFEAFWKIYRDGISTNKMLELSKTCIDNYSYSMQVKLIEQVMDKIKENNFAAKGE